MSWAPGALRASEALPLLTKIQTTPSLSVLQAHPVRGFLLGSIWVFRAAQGRVCAKLFSPPL
jgi:hypothetical protein